MLFGVNDLKSDLVLSYYAGAVTYVSIDAIYIIGKFPANDPLLMLQRMAENRTNLSYLLTKTLDHMNQVLMNPSCSFDQYFNTDRAAAADIVCEARMIEAFFRYCHLQNIANVNLGGLRMDVTNQSEMQSWNKYVNAVTQARRKHFQIVTGYSLQDRSNLRESRLPVELWNNDYFPGMNFRKISTAVLQQHVIEYCQSQDLQVSTKMNMWMNALDHDDQYSFLPDGQAFARNCGVWMKIKTESKHSEAEEFMESVKKRDKSDAKNNTMYSMPQPQQDVAMIRLLLANLSAEKDPLDEFFETEDYIPSVEWLKTEMGKIGRQVDAIQWLKDAIGEYQIHTRAIMQVDTRRVELSRMAGTETHPVHDAVKWIEDKSDLQYISRMKMQKLSTTLNLNMQIMRTCELEQFQCAAMLIDDLKKQNGVAGLWIEDFETLRAYEQAIMNEHSDDSKCISLLNNSTLFAKMASLATKRIDGQVSYCNQMLIELERCCVMTHCMNTPGAYGQTLRVMDMAGTVRVLKASDSKSHGRVSETYLYDAKFAGAGLDQSKNFAGTLMNAHLSFNAINLALIRFREGNTDESHQMVSKMSFCTLMGCGFWINSDGKILSHNYSVDTKLGRCCFWSEFGKEGSDQNTLAHIESHMAHSGNTHNGNVNGVTEASWNTTQSMESKTNVQLRKLPVTIITGNRPCSATPASLFEGGRCLPIAASVQCFMNGFVVLSASEYEAYKKLKKHRAGIKLGHGAGQSSSSAKAHSKANFGKKNLKQSIKMAHDLCRDDMRCDMKKVDLATARKNRLYLLIVGMWRKEVALMCSSLSVNPVESGYTMRSNFNVLKNSVESLTRGLRRSFLQDKKNDSNIFHRNGQGPWGRVLQVAMHVQITTANCFISALRRVHNGWPLDLHAAYFACMKELMTAPISFTATLASLYTWLASAVLDINLMIVSSYMYHMTKFQSYCSLRVLSHVLILSKKINKICASFDEASKSRVANMVENADEDDDEDCDEYLKSHADKTTKTNSLASLTHADGTRHKQQKQEKQPAKSVKNSNRSLKNAIYEQLQSALSDDEIEAYMSLCHHILNCVVKHPSKTDQENETNIRLVPAGILQVPDKPVLEHWFHNIFSKNFEANKTTAHARAGNFNFSNHDAILNASSAKKSLQSLDTRNCHSSVYCSPRLAFTHTSAVRGFGKPSANFNNTVEDKNITGTVNRIVASIFGAQQSPEMHKLRANNAGLDLRPHENTDVFWSAVRSGTALPKENSNSNDVFKLCFPNPEQTGIWWDETMDNAGTCQGVLKNFLLQSNLDVNITHQEFFETFMLPFWELTNSDKSKTLQIHDNAEWQKPILSDDNDIFAFGLNPTEDGDGVNVQLCMQLIHYVVIQGLGVCKDWSKMQHTGTTSSAPSFVSCTHLRNMSHISAGLMSLFLHTCVDKANIPANDGKINLPLPSPDYNVVDSVSIEYDPDLHIDTHQREAVIPNLLSNESEIQALYKYQMLSVCTRFSTNENWCVLKLKNSAHLQYKNADHNVSEQKEIFPFAPESVAHVQNILHDMKVAYTRFYKCSDVHLANSSNVDEDLVRVDDVRAHILNQQQVHTAIPSRTSVLAAFQYANNFAEAMYVYGQSVRTDQVFHQQNTLTACAIENGKEIPCVSWEHGFLFTARIVGKNIVFEPIVQQNTDFHMRNVLHNDSVVAFQSLPIDMEKNTCNILDWSECMKHGLRINLSEDSSMAECLMHSAKFFIDISYCESSKTRCLPFYAFPIVEWPALVMLRVDCVRPGHNIQIDGEQVVRVHHETNLLTAEDLYAQHAHYKMLLNCQSELWQHSLLYQLHLQNGITIEQVKEQIHCMSQFCTVLAYYDCSSYHENNVENSSSSIDAICLENINAGCCGFWAMRNVKRNVAHSNLDTLGVEAVDIQEEHCDKTSTDTSANSCIENESFTVRVHFNNATELLHTTQHKAWLGTQLFEIDESTLKNYANGAEYQSEDSSDITLDLLQNTESFKHNPDKIIDEAVLTKLYKMHATEGDETLRVLPDAPEHAQQHAQPHAQYQAASQAALDESMHHFLKWFDSLVNSSTAKTRELWPSLSVQGEHSKNPGNYLLSTDQKNRVACVIDTKKCLHHKQYLKNCRIHHAEAVALYWDFSTNTECREDAILTSENLYNFILEKKSSLQALSDATQYEDAIQEICEDMHDMRFTHYGDKCVWHDSALVYRSIDTIVCFDLDACLPQYVPVGAPGMILKDTEFLSEPYKFGVTKIQCSIPSSNDYEDAHFKDKHKKCVHGESFLRGGSYCVQVWKQNNTSQSETPLFNFNVMNMDFVQMSLAMIQEGTELWIKLTPSLYNLLLEQAHADDPVTLPITSDLQKLLQREASTVDASKNNRVFAYLRAFYVLGGSDYEIVQDPQMFNLHMHSNLYSVTCDCVDVMVVVAQPRCEAGNANAMDDHANEHSIVNIDLQPKDTRLIKFNVPIMSCSTQQAISFHRDPAMPHYNYMKWNSKH